MIREMMGCQEYKEIISAHVDGTLSFEETLEVQSHLAGCPQCKQKFLWETKMKGFLKQRLSPLQVRPALTEGLLGQLEEKSKEGFLSWSYKGPGLVYAFAILLLMAVPYLVWHSAIQEDLFTNAVAQYQKLAKETSESSPENAARNSSARVLDLSPWGYRLLARQSTQFKGQEGRIFVYQGEGKEFLLAQEFEGLNISSPPAARSIRASKADFVSYRRQGVNLIAWKEKDLVCILTSTLPEDKLLGLARQIAEKS